MQGLHPLRGRFFVSWPALFLLADWMSDTPFYKLVPKDRDENLAWRAFTNARAARDPAFASAVRAACKRDILFWINGFVWTFDPRLNKQKKQAKIPMITFEFQDTCILKLRDAILSGSDLLIEKSRDMGASWMCLLVFLWFWSFRRLQSFLVGSRTQDYVDKTGNPKCLFWKLRFALKEMAPWLRPDYVSHKNHLLHLETASVIDGEATNDDFGSGDRRTAILLDEFAKVPRGHMVWMATRDVTDCRIVNSTHKGTSTEYYRISVSGIVKLRIHWSLHPHKAVGLYTQREGKYVILDSEYWSKVENPEARMRELDEKILAKGVAIENAKLRSAWYAVQCERSTHAVDIAQELDIDVLGSSYQFFNVTSIEAYIKRHARVPMLVGELLYDDTTLTPTGFRKDEHGHFKLWVPVDANGFPVRPSVSIGFDVSAGTGSSNSAASGINYVTLEKVMEYANPHIRPEEFGRLAVVIARWFGNAKIIWEQNGPGRQFGAAVIEAGYRHVYMQTDEKNLIKKPSTIPGYPPTKDGQRTLLGDYRRGLETEQIINYSEPALRDSLEFIYLPDGRVEHQQAANNVDPTGARDNHGDRTIADALGWKLVKDVPMPDRKRDRKTGAGRVVPGSFEHRRALAKAKANKKSVWG